ncbi:MAG: hypothetical protein IPM07_10620 [Anaerolineales bacterium]|nr:hypothetical protein [Anaerolineales bacterium]
MLSINREAMKIVRRILDAPDALGVVVSRLACGATVIDMGQQAPGGLGRGQALHAGHAGRIGRGELRTLRRGRPRAVGGARDDRPPAGGVCGFADRGLAAGRRARGRADPGRAGACAQPCQPRPLL